MTVKTGKMGLAILFLFACCFGILSETAASATETARPSYYYGSAPYEQEAESGVRYPDYLPLEFGRKPQPEQVQPTQMPGIEEKPLSADFVPYGEAQERYSAPSSAAPAKPEPPQPEPPQPPAGAAPEITVQNADGFVPYEYAREKYSN